MQTITVPDGRQLGYTEMGDPDGIPVIYQHGWQYPRLWHPDVEIAREAGVRLLCLDRAGYGESTLQPDRSMTDSAGDVTALADQLGIDRFAVLGWSLGGLHALAAAAAMPQRVTHVVACGSLGLIDEPGALRQLSWISAMPRRLRHVPVLQRAWLKLQGGQVTKDVTAFVDGSIRHFSPPDQAVMRDPLFRPVIEESQAVAWADGVDGILADYNSAAPLAFQMSQVPQHVDLVHGAADTIVDVAMARRLDELLRDSRLQVLPDAGHFAVLTHWEQLIGLVATTARETQQQ
ncbi:MAG: alpha/beta hydrolase [Jiangellales bacterium]